MPAATPVPRGPTVLTLYSAMDLLTGPGCPVCRYAGEAADRYLGWFAFEAHADAGMITRLCSSLGMCPRHTRALMSQPGAARRLTVVYRYVLAAARDRMGGRAARPGGCPACEHDDGAASRALDTLLDGLADGPARERYRRLGGLCIPHLRAASQRTAPQVTGWLAATLTEAATARRADPGWLAGTDPDARLRAVLRHAVPAGAPPGPGMCAACRAAACTEASHLAGMLRAVGPEPNRRVLLCAGHLGDLIVLADPHHIQALLAWQAASLTAALAPPAPSPDRDPGRPAIWPWSRRRRPARLDACPVCVARDAAAQQAAEEIRASLRAARQVPLCVRHLLGLKAADTRAWKLAAPAAVGLAEMLIAELDEAFSKSTWARRREPTGPEMTAWGRAAAFLDGSVFLGCPPSARLDRSPYLRGMVPRGDMW